MSKLVDHLVKLCLRLLVELNMNIIVLSKVELALVRLKSWCNFTFDHFDHFYCIRCRWQRSVNKCDLRLVYVLTLHS